MQQTEQLVEHIQKHGLRPAARPRVASLERGLGELDVPVTEGMPGELVEARGSLGKLERGEGAFHVLRDVLEAGENPPVGKRQPPLLQCRLFRVEVPEVEQDEAGRIPQLVGKGAVAIDALERELDVPALLGERGQRITQRVGAEGWHPPGNLFRTAGGRASGLRPVDDVQGVNDVALHLGHLLALLIAHHGVQENGAEGHVLHEVQARASSSGRPRRRGCRGPSRARWLGRRWPVLECAPASRAC